jgi:hypothetical protein
MSIVKIIGSSDNTVKVSNTGIKVVTVGTQGPRGITGTLSDASDVSITNPETGDTLAYDQASGAFVNTHQSNFTDGGNF